MEVRVVGSERFSQAEILAATKLKLGSTVSPSDLKAVASKLGGLGVFSSVGYRYKPLGPGVAVEFKVVDAERLLPCRFANFVWFTQDELIVALRSRVSLFNGQAAPGGNQAEGIRAALEALLKERGISGHVTFEATGVRDGKPTELAFMVEGGPIIVREVELSGMTQIDRETLGRMTGAVVGGTYDPGLVNTFFVANLKLEYGDKGYLKTLIGPPSTELIKHEGPETWVRLTIPVKEGPQYHWGEIQWTGNKALTETDLVKQLGLKPGDVANQGLLEKGLLAVANLYAGRGYAREQTKQLPTFNDDQRTVSYELRVDEGAVYRMGKLTITGPDESTAARLEEASHLKPGQLYDRSYWPAYLRSTAGSLPPALRQTSAIKEDIDDTAKTVNVTISLGPQAAP